MKKRVNEIGSVGLQRILHRRKRTVGDPLSVGRVTTKHQASKGFRTEGEREGVALRLKQDKTKGKMGGGASRIIKNRRLGLTDSKETNSYDRIYNLLTEMRKEDLEHYKGRPSRKKVKKKKKKSPPLPAEVLKTLQLSRKV